MELVVYDGGKDPDDGAYYRDDKREGNNMEPDKAQRAREKQKTQEDGGNACSVPPDGTSKCGRRPGENNMTNNLVTYANERDERRTARS